MPSVSVIVLTYKRPDELDGVLENVFRLDPAPEEILVYDDDPQGSARAAKLLDNPAVRYIVAEQNAGPAGARNRAAAFAAGDILFFIDDDCRLESTDAVATLRELFSADDMGCVATLIRNAFTGEIVPKEFPGYDVSRWEEPHEVSYFLAGGFAIRRALFLALGGFDPLLYHGEEEVELSFRILHAGCRMYYTPQIVVTHRESPKGRETIHRAYRLVRNRIYLAVKHMPFPYLFSHLFLWSGFAFLQALRGREVGEFFRGLRSVWQDNLWASARAYRRAHPMRRETVRYLREHEGRLWY